MADLTIAFFYADLGNAWWRTACTEMLRSAKRVMPDAHIAQLSPKGTSMHPWADELVEVNLAADAPKVADMLSKVKGYAVAQYAMRATGPVIFTDADVIWTARPPTGNNFAVAEDDTTDHLPLRQFYIQSAKTAAWVEVIGLLDALPPSTWKADAFELALNICFHGSDYQPRRLNPAATQKFVHHFPGVPETMIAFARSLDKGEPFKELDPTRPKLGVNEDLTSISFGDFNPNAKLTIPSQALQARLDMEAAGRAAVEGADVA